VPSLLNGSTAPLGCRSYSERRVATARLRPSEGNYLIVKFGQNVAEIPLVAAPFGPALLVTQDPEETPRSRSVEGQYFTDACSDD